jgi:hypothetical protein
VREQDAGKGRKARVAGAARAHAAARRGARECARRDAAAYDAAARAARELAVIAPWRLDEYTLVLHVRAHDGELLFAAALQPRLASGGDARHSRERVIFGEEAGIPNACATDCAASRFDARCTASVFAERVLPSGRVHVAALFVDKPVAAIVTRTTDTARLRLRYLNNWSDDPLRGEPSAPWLTGVCSRAFGAERGAGCRLLAFSNAREGGQEVNPLTTFVDTGESTICDSIQRNTGWLALALRVPPPGDRARDVTAVLAFSLMHYGVDDWGEQNEVVTQDVTATDLEMLLRKLQWRGSY